MDAMQTDYSRDEADAKGSVLKEAKWLEECDTKMCKTDEKQQVQADFEVPQVHLVNDQRGTLQQIVRSDRFELGSAAAICIYSLWLAYDVQENQKPLLKADLIFKLGEGFFLIIFTMEWFSRFQALPKKSHLVRDGWLIFDTAMVLLMVADTLVVTGVMWLTASEDDAFGGASVMRAARLLRIVRILRLSRILKLMPELLVLVKGIRQATRSVFFTSILLGIVIYVFAILLCQLTDSTTVGEKHFTNVSKSAYTLLLVTMFPDTDTVMDALSSENWMFGVMFFLFILLTSLVVINLLIGVIVEMVSHVSSDEHDLMDRALVWSKMQQVLTAPGGVDENQDGVISKLEFREMLKNTAALKALNQVGVDLRALVDHAEFFFDEGTETLNTDELIELVMQLRVRNPAMVKDIADLRLLVHTQFMKIENMHSISCPGAQAWTEPTIDHTRAPIVTRRSKQRVRDFWEHSVPSFAKDDLHRRLGRLEDAVKNMVQMQCRIVERMRASNKDLTQMPKAPTSVWANTKPRLHSGQLYSVRGKHGHQHEAPKQ